MLIGANSVPPSERKASATSRLAMPRHKSSGWLAPRRVTPSAGSNVSRFHQHLARQAERLSLAPRCDALTARRRRMASEMKESVTGKGYSTSPNLG